MRPKPRELSNAVFRSASAMGVAILPTRPHSSVGTGAGYLPDPRGMAMVTLSLLYRQFYKSPQSKVLPRSSVGACRLRADLTPSAM
jgi:hypothetical protein